MALFTATSTSSTCWYVELGEWDDGWDVDPTDAAHSVVHCALLFAGPVVTGAPTALVLWVST